jgi:GT2 family glycosyltransferase
MPKKIPDNAADLKILIRDEVNRLMKERTIEEALEPKVRDLLRRLPVQHRRFAFYGAGSHSSILIRLWSRHHGPPVSLMIVTDRRMPISLDGLPVVAADDFAPAAVDAVILSSQLFEVEMYTECRRRWPNLPVYPLWLQSDRLQFQSELHSRLLPVIEGCHKDGVRRVAVFGAGSHTELLLQFWRRAQGPNITAILNRGPAPLSGPQFDLPVVDADRLPRVDADAIVISSHSFESELLRYCRTRWPSMPIYTIWAAPKELESLSDLERLARCVIRQCHCDGIRTVAMYGAGSHTRQLLPIWKTSGGPMVAALLESRALGNEELEGTPIVTIDQFQPSLVDAVVLSSRSFESTMFETCRERWPSLPVYPIWNPGLPRTAQTARHELPRLIHRLRVQTIKEVTLAGPLQLLRVAFPIWLELGGPAVRDLICTDRKIAQQALNFPVLHPAKLPEKPPDLVLMLGDDHDSRLERQITKRWAHTPIQRCPLGPRSTGEAAHIGFPRSAPNNAASTVTERNLRWRPLISIITPTFNVERTILSRCLESVLAQSYTNWELCIVNDGSTRPHVKRLLNRYAQRDGRIKPVHLEENRGITLATNHAIDQASGEFLAFLDSDDELAPHALLEIVARLNDEPDLDVVYSDEDKISPEGVEFEPFFKPDWSPEYFRGVMYVGHLLTVKTALARRVGLLDPRFNLVQDYEFMLRLSERTARIGHIPKVLYHWRQVPGSAAAAPNAKGDLGAIQAEAVQTHLNRLGLDATAEPLSGNHRVGIWPRARRTSPVISIILLTRNRADDLDACLQGIFGKTTYPNIEVVLVDNMTSDPRALEVMRRYPVRRFLFPDPFNFSTANNFGVKQSSGEYVVVLNNDVEVITPGWLEAMLYYAEQPDVGVVGPLLLYPDRSVQHAGVTLGFRGTADHIMRGYPADADGYHGSLMCARECSAVTGACLMVKQSDYKRLGGLNEHYERHYQDLDFCLLLRREGKRNIVTPRAVLYHRESLLDLGNASFYSWFDRLLLLDRFQDLMDAGDPYYNPNFDLKDPRRPYQFNGNGA